MEKYDLHIHSIYSDGEYTPQQIIDRLIECGIGIFSITDHDNIESIKEMENVDTKGVIYIPGIEVSCEKDGYKMHILGYNVDGNNETLIEMCKNMKLRKNIRNLEIIQQLKDQFGVIISKEETEALLNAKSFVGQTTIAKLLTQKGQIPNVKYAFQNYFKYMDLKTPATTELSKAIEIIHSAGGYAVLAHPISIEREYGVNIEDIFEMFVDAGIDGIEIFNSKHTLSDIKRYVTLAKEEGLLISGGSDYHGEIVKPNVKLGKVSKDGTEKEHHYNMTVISQCVDKENILDISKQKGDVR
ncbi:MAG: PHP domain-containing protein [Clostridia bacterium]|nr:PHP domain-containing protein [Clostridia bacterium]